MGFLDNLKLLFRRKKKNIEELQQVEQQQEENSHIEETYAPTFYTKEEEEIIKRDFIYGYIVKTLKSIEESLKRIEANMPTKEWASLNLAEKKDLEKLINDLEEKLNSISLLKPSLSASSASSRPSRSSEMIKKAIEIIRERKEISYEDLARELGISASYLRAIASLIEASDSKIKRVIKDKKGYFVFEDNAIENSKEVQDNEDLTA